MRPIKFRAWDNKYEIGNDGSVFSLNYNNSGKRKQMKQYLDDDGYPYVVLVHKNKRTKLIIHRAVAKLFLPSPSTPKHQVNHKNGIRKDNRLENLEWLTGQENTLHGWRSNKRKQSQKVIDRVKKQFGGTKNPKAKITYEVAMKIRELRKKGEFYKVIAKKFGISVSQVGQICTGKFWKETPELLEGK